MDPVDWLCGQYQYPELVRNCLRECCEEFLVVRPVSIALIGSAARGEMSWVETRSGIELLSDLEFVLFTKDGLTTGELSYLRRRIADVGKSVSQRNPYFHIDWTLIRQSQSAHVARNIATFEMRELGRTLYGDDKQLNRLPQISVHNLNMRAVNQLVLIRLWWLLAGIPKNVVTGCESGFEGLLFQYVACRNLLDIPTILLPNEGYLLAGYATRERFLCEDFHHLPSSTHMGGAFPDDVAMALRKKKDPSLEIPEMWCYGRTVHLFACLIRYLLGMPRDASVRDICDELVQERCLLDSPVLSRERVRRILKGGAHWLRHPSLGQPWRLTRPVEGSLVAALLSMHYALLNLLRGCDARASNWIRAAASFLQPVRPMSLRLGGSDSEKWLQLRHIAAQILYHSYSTLERRRAFVATMLEWQDPIRED